MKAEIAVEVIVVGNELLNGVLADTNTARFGALMARHGLSVLRGQVVPDDAGAIGDALELAASRSDLVLTSGGLGPTSDDLTIASAASWAGLELIEHPPTLEGIKRRFAARGIPFTPNNARQAMIPRGATVLDNPVGTAPGVRMTHRETTFFFFPGVPRELERLAEDYLSPWLAENAPVRSYKSCIFKTFGRTESQVATLLDGIDSDPNVHVAYRAHFPEIHVSLHVLGGEAGDADGLLTRIGAQVRERLGPIVFGEDAEGSFAQAVGAALGAAGATLATAESCTGGWAAKLITDVPGSSAWLMEAVVTYSNEAKTRRLGVPAALLEARGAVSEEVARAMAEGLRDRAGTSHAVATTGIAGPGGGRPDKPVGTIHVALATAEGTRHRRLSLPFDRERNRLLTAYVALEMVRRALTRSATDETT